MKVISPRVCQAEIASRREQVNNRCTERLADRCRLKDRPFRHRAPARYVRLTKVQRIGYLTISDNRDTNPWHLRSGHQGLDLSRC